ncbi:hypothetical protein SUGI_0997000 [Cryptomeria japonica]|nr:hypothetical protein SUGI_0997000 [Cryptomeria japonica]
MGGDAVRFIVTATAAVATTFIYNGMTKFRDGERGKSDRRGCNDGIRDGQSFSRGQIKFAPELDGLHCFECPLPTT